MPKNKDRRKVPEYKISRSHKKKGPNKWGELAFYAFCSASFFFLLVFEPLLGLALYICIGLIHATSFLKKGTSLSWRIPLVLVWLPITWLWVMGLFQGWLDEE